MEHFFTTIKAVFIGIFNYTKSKVIVSFVVPLFAFMFGFENILILKCLMLLVVIDFVTGIISAYMSGDAITSRRAVKSAFKVAIYGVLISSAHLSEKIIPSGLFIETIVSSFLALTEFVSILENTGKMGYGIPKKLLNKLQQLRDEK